ncbi:hypothetical protein Bca52824_004036 [Brassica carinata]|uniref:AAA+ ATPase domain-containing protein n=1 Tax=Brassica carinata TaxID=52824 RepID=A0A8X7WNQ0_BRACI|nr:hypothetical protein Bca52824_004036 [Brassica carinata]
MDSCGKDLSTAEEIVDDLRSRYGKYARMSRQTLVLNVRNVLNARNNNKKQRVKEDEEEDDDSDEGAGGGKMKKQRRRLDDEKEERAHVKEKSAYSYSSSSEYDGGHISTADLTSDMLRGSYATKMNNSSTKLAPPPPPLSGGNNKVGPTFKDFAGIKKVLDELDQYILSPLLNPPLFGKIGAKPPSGILFHGPPGCGKTRLANAVANEAGVPFYQISATQVLSGVPDEDLDKLFVRIASLRDSPDDDRSWLRQPWSDEDLDKLFVRIASLRDSPDDDRSWLRQPWSDEDLDKLFVRIASLRDSPDDDRSWLRQPWSDEDLDKLFVRIASLRDSPDDDRSWLRQPWSDEDLDKLFVRIASLRDSPDDDRSWLRQPWSDEDLDKLFVRIASLRDSPDDDRSWLRQPWSDEDLDKLFVRMSDFEEAVKLVKGSLTREGFSTVPDVSWDDVGGLDHLRTQLKDYVVNPIKYPETFEEKLRDRFLALWTTGCGKTLVAKAVANEAGANFIYIKGPELLNKYVGESERAIRTLFQRARTSSPCVVFFDEVDALTARRGREGDWVVGGLLNQFLTELHGGDRRDVYVIGATNRLDVIDPAFLRPGRFGNLVYVPLPNADDRVSILKSIANKRPLDPSVDLDAIAYKYCQGFSGADLANLMDKAIHVAVKEKFQSIESSEDGAMDLSDCTIKMTHFKQALSLVTPSVSKQQIKHYEEQRDKLQRSTGRNNMDQINVGPSFAHE